MIHALEQFKHAALDLLYPPHCLACGEALNSGGNRVCCESCEAAIKLIGGDRCRRCGSDVENGRGVVESCPACHSYPPPYLSGCCAYARYKAPLRDVLLALKFGAGLQAGDWLGQRLAQRMKITGLLADLDKLAGPVALVPVPLVRRDMGRRGFNQAEEIARASARHLQVEMGKGIEIRVEPRLLRKVRKTEPQALLDRTVRRSNLSGAFSADAVLAKRYRAGAAVVVDDVMTTGATVGECARTLHGAGIQILRAAVIARG